MLGSKSASWRTHHRYTCDAYSIPFKEDLEAPTNAVLSASLNGRKYRVTLRRFQWLLPVAQKWERMVWIPTETVVSCE